MYRVAARFRDPESQAIAERYAGFTHSNLEEYMTLLWRDPELKPAPMAAIPLARHFEDSGVVFFRTSWNADALAFAFKAGPPEGHRVTGLLAKAPEWRLSSGHAHPDANSFIIWAHGRYLTGDTGYSGLVSARQHNTITVGGAGQGVEKEHDVFRAMSYAALDRTRIVSADLAPDRATIVGEAATSYPDGAGVTRFTRTFSFTAPGRFVIEDHVDTSSPRTVEMYLHADQPVRGTAWQFQIGPADVWLETTVTAPQGSRSETGITELRAPGQPGSIEKGEVEQRGFELKVSTPAATSTRFLTEMLVKRR